ncbi:bifunctional riboflavin kinase/FAD synthetase [Paenibacillus segetis]|uniref:Riboflavin biosynthesis protein n=1 Tax=Paenibacillus segetis TaxID=1325360 RepID=A0ABQ1YE35_9BACL|nr:bifunctional riboflavin kinase/FAD synthetase [Paenibacillus segetis]GGH21568.1 riboflavin biosynthesis protein [Paenibacillus segetis]
MEIIEVTSTPPNDLEPVVLVIGKFDGVHKGHQLIFDTARELMEEEDQLAVYSFSDHPQWILRQDPKFEKKLTPDAEKFQILKDLGVQRYYRVQFTKEYANITAREFILDHISRLHVKRIVVGEGFHFGKGSESSIEELVSLCAQINVAVTVVPLLKEEGNIICSSDVRSLVEDGNMDEAWALLGRPYTVTGTVIHGRKLGRELGFPTINLGGTDSYVFPKPGVYMGSVEIHDGNFAQTNWNVLISAGYRPTVNGSGYLIEAHLLDFSGDLYGATVSVSFLKFMRGEIKFSGLDSLIAQMTKDMAEAKSVFQQM